MRKKLFFLVLLFFSCTAWAQTLNDTIYSEINRLRREKVDTIIRFGLPEYRINIADTLSGFGIVHPFEIGYLLYKVNGKLYSKKFEWYSNKDGDNVGTIVSIAYEVTHDSIFSWINSRLTRIRGEDIYPYVYKLDINNSSYYIPFEHSNMEYYFVGVYTSEEDIGKQLNPDAFEKNIHSTPVNLNYDNNHRTMLSEFYFLLLDLFYAIDKKYVFSGGAPVSDSHR